MTTPAWRAPTQPIDSPLSVRNLVVETVGPQEVLEWADGVASQCPLVQFEPAADRWRHLPRTIKRLRQGGKLRVVMLGDSICNDTSNSLYETLLARHYPGARIEIVTSVRGGAGCWFYKDENRIQECVLDYKPDLLMIAGISHRFDPEPIRSVIRQVRQAFAVVKDGEKTRPIAVGMYPKWNLSGKANPVKWTSAVGSVAFEPR